ncbi:phage tail tip lysozyme [Bradyrhizobium cosmicum]|uniref:Phage tail lysozyme domain-containing protein n=1 Tax=Bradyrhizobium cosmicum TaxID=1404864 RepID=A0AAI8MDX9_9BRAD|nr:phage tail tip lysozyme [Bradyrhizobium cosmicum]BAL76831.1 hypothetical protein S23_36320 [Bradyrhizobium cosmicum]
MSFTKPNFAKECVIQALYCGTNPHYLIAVAQMRSGLTDTNNAAGDEIGPFRLTQTDFNQFCTDNEFDFHFQTTDISLWFAQIAVFALMAHRAGDKFFLANNRNPTAKELYLQQWPTPPNATKLSADLTATLNQTAGLISTAADKVLDDPVPPLTIPDPNQPPPGPSAGPLNLSSITPQARLDMANKIQQAFQAANLGKFQQACAVANAIAESNLNPNAHAAIGEDSWGLFQLNRMGGLGKGHNPDDLKNPDTNISIVIAEAKKYPEFVSADSIDRAVSAFVRDVERPADAAGQIRLRTSIAQRFL